MPQSARSSRIQKPAYYIGLLILSLFGFTNCSAWPMAIALAAGSGGGGGGGLSPIAFLGANAGGRTLTGVQISLASSNVAQGMSTAAQATAIYSDNTTSDITSNPDTVFESGTPANATVSGSTISAIGVGTSNITASYQGMSSAAMMNITPAVLVSLQVTPTNPSIAKGFTQQLTATGTFSDGSTQDITTQVAWSTTDATIASVSNTAPNQGLSVGVASPFAGTAVIKATHAATGINGSTSVTVTAATLVSISITPAAPTTPKGLTNQFTATGTFSDFTTQDLTATVSWSSSNAVVASISNTAGSQGLASGNNTGTVTITATSGVISGTTSMTVSAAVLASIDVTPTNSSIAKGLTQQFTAIGTYSDATTQDLTSSGSLVWTESTGGVVATISNAAGSHGLATAVGTGSTTITASGPGGITGATTFSVTAATLVSIAVTPTNPSAAKGLTRQFIATGTYTDLSNQDLTSTVTWSESTSGSVATVSNASGSHGLAAAVNAGASTITATFGGKSGTTTFTVTAATLVSIAVSPTNPSIAKGLTEQFTATGTYTDASTQDLTTSVSWSSSNAGLVTISNAAGSHGLASAAAVGSVTITATSGVITGTTTFMVSAATLSSVAVTPTNHSIAKGLAQQFTATGTYSDSSTQDLTTAATWGTSDASVSTISNAGGSQGLATTVNTGSATITASYGGKSGSSTITVTAATLVSIAVTPAATSIAKGLTQQFTATGTYSDSSIQDITTAVTWNSGTPAVAVISNAGGSEGLASALTAGSTVITATHALSGISGNTAFTVTAATLVSIAVTPTNPSMAVSRTKQFTAIGTYTDSSTQDLTSSVTWSSTDTSKAVISNAAGSRGIASSISAGSTTVIATSGLTSGSTSLTVTAATLVSITVTPVNPSLAIGYTLQFTATGIYSDSSTQNLTADGTCSWSSNSAGTGTVSNAAGTRGLATGVSVGTTTITHTCGAVSGSSILAVTAATLQGLTITPAAPTIAKGTWVQFSAIGTFSDNSTADLTTQVTWTSSSGAVATISNAAGSNGKASSVDVGSTTIKATHVASGTFAVVILKVTSATLSSIATTPAGALAIGYGTYQQFTATGTYSDGSTQDITALVTWSESSSTAVAAISNASPTNGRATSVSAGLSTITATLGAISGSSNLEVRNLVLTSIAVSPANPSVQSNTTQQFQATGTYNDGTQQDLTTQVTWTSTAPAVATISNAFGTQGIAASVGTNGQTSTISATRDGVIGTTTLTVISDVTAPTVLSAVLLPGNVVQVTYSEPVKVSQAQVAGSYKITTLVSGVCSDNSNFSGSSSAVGISSVSVVSGTVYNLNLSTGTGATTYTVLVDKTAVQDIAGNNTGCANSANFAGADTVAPTVNSAVSASGTVVRVTFSETVNTAQARTAANYKIVVSPAGGSCAGGDNFSSSSQTSDFTITSVSGSGAVYDLTLSSTQVSGRNYTVLVNPGSIYDVAMTPNALGCPNNADFTGLEQIKLSSAVCVDTTHVIATFSKNVKTGLNGAGSAECTSITECANRYQFTGATSLGSISDARVLNGTLCGGAAADSSKVCITHTTAQGGGQYTVTAANYPGSGGDADGFDNSGWGSIRDSGNTEDLQPAPNDRRTFTGCASTPQNFTDGPIASNPFVDGSSFGYLATYNSKVYIGPNSVGNAANRFNADGSSPESLTFRLPKDTNATGSTSASTASAPFTSLGHSGCTTNSNVSATGCGPDNEDTRGLFASGALGGSTYLFIGGGKTTANFNHIYYTADTDTQLDFNYIDFGALSGSNTQTFSSISVMDSRLYMGFARQPTNRPDFVKVSFNSGDASKCTAGANCDVTSGSQGVRLNIHFMNYLGGAATTANYAYYVGVDSLFVFNNLLYVAGGGHHYTNRDGAIIRSTVINPGACASAGTCANWTEISPRGLTPWNNTATRFSLELNKVTNLIPADKAFPAFDAFNGNLYVIRNTCTVQGANSNDGSAHSVAGCNDGTVTNRQPQLWKCTPGTTGGATTCEAGDWTLVADNGSGFTNMGNSNNKVVSMLVTNGSQMYIGYDNAVDGVQVYRTKAGVTNPTSASDFEQIGSSGFGDPTNIQQIYSGLSLSQLGVYYLYVSGGKGALPVRVYRQQNP